MPAARSSNPATVMFFGPNRPIARGASTTMPIMISTVMGTRAAPLGNAV